MLNMESQILIVLQFRLTSPTVLEFYELFIHRAGLGQMANEIRKKDEDFNEKKEFTSQEKQIRKIVFLGRYLIELSQLEFSYNKYKPSLIAAAALFMAMKLFKQTPYWSNTMVQLTHYNENQLRIVTSDLCLLLENIHNIGLQSIIRKFSQKHYEHISQIKIIKNKNTNNNH